MTLYRPAQVKTITKETRSGNVLIIELKYGDEHKNGHNTFTITASLYNRGFCRYESFVLNSKGKKRYLGACGCLHDEIAQFAPELSHLLKWHLCSNDGPLHYMANTLYWAKVGKFTHARASAIWEDATEEDLLNPTALADRLPGLLEEFQGVIESIGFTF